MDEHKEEILKVVTDTLERMANRVLNIRTHRRFLRQMREDREMADCLQSRVHSLQEHNMQDVLTLYRFLRLPRRGQSYLLDFHVFNPRRGELPALDEALLDQLYSMYDDAVSKTSGSPESDDEDLLFTATALDQILNPREPTECSDST